MYNASESSAGANQTPNGGEEFFSIADLARAVRKRLWLLGVVAFLCVGAAVGASFLQPPTYQATATVVVGPKGGRQDNLSSSITGLQALTTEMAVAGLNPSMVEEVVNNEESSAPSLSASDLNDNLTVGQVESTRYLSFTYQGADPDTAQEVANSAADIFARDAPEASAMAANATVKVSALAPEPQALKTPDPVRSGLLALALGLMLGTGLAFLLERFGSGWDSPEEVERELGVPNFGTVPDFGQAEPRLRLGRGKIAS